MGSRLCLFSAGTLAALYIVFASVESFAFPDFTPLKTSELYEKRLRFSEGTPRILVGIMKGQKQVQVSARGPIRLMFTDDSIPKTVYGKAKQRYKFRVRSSKPAEIQHWVVVETHIAKDGAYPSKEESTWRKRGYKTTVLETGTLFAVRGRVLDTRSWLVALGGFASEKRAQQLMEKLSRIDLGLDSLFLHKELIRAPSGIIGIYDHKGRLRHEAKGSVYVGSTSNSKILVDAVEFGKGYKWHGRANREYREHMYIAIDENGELTLINSISAEKLLAGLVPAEIFATAPAEALKAQAVTARGEIFSKLGHRHFEDPFHLCSEQHCQVYAGAQSEQKSTNKAVKATRGLLVARPKKTKFEPIKIVDTRYSSSSGGYSEANEVVWGTIPSVSLRPKLDGPQSDPALARYRDGLNESNIRSFLESFPPTWSAKASMANHDKYRWVRTISATVADQMVAHLGVGKLRNVEVLGRGKGGRVSGIRVSGSKGQKVVLRELPVRRLFGNLNSGMFVVDVIRDSNNFIKSLKFTGGGWGHGVGMCQMGAIGRAESGQTFRQILGHYYNGAEAVPLY
ncbi:MAG: SpoIID/LytB domain-containing protein [Myxococcota bacterium]|nr:SpoIID/LytB domain-containing protein [Myxococcota bacterium]